MDLDEILFFKSRTGFVGHETKISKKIKRKKKLFIVKYLWKKQSKRLNSIKCDSFLLKKKLK